ncbi:MAG TPA: signal peptidase II [bacterium]|nr:signal peptidase II [bacterium]
MPVFLSFAVFALALDRFTKYIVKANMELYSSFPVIDGLLYITHIENPGVVFGLFSGQGLGAGRWILAALVTLASIGVIVYWSVNKQKNFLFNTSCGLILGGAIGNLIDRVATGLVTDFIEVGYKGFTWPLFNAADMAVTTGVGLMIIYVITQKEV